MIRQSLVRRNLRAGAPYTEPLPEPSGPLARPSTTHIDTEPSLFCSDEEVLGAVFDRVVAAKRTVHGSRLSTIAHHLEPS